MYDTKIGKLFGIEDVRRKKVSTPMPSVEWELCVEMYLIASGA
jgi:hypothetical protein